MNHRTYDGQRFSPIARINKDSVKNLKLAYAVPLAGGAGKEFHGAQQRHHGGRQALF
jgi:glucose dehydrogenase